MDSKEQVTEQATVVHTVTKQKHPGRVAQGHKLAVLMKKRKDELLQNKTSKQVSEQPPEQPPVQSSPTPIILGILALVGAAYYFYKQQKPAAPAPKKAKIYME